MPIVMAFNSVPLLISDGTRFTSGNAASPSTASGDTADFLRSIPFDRVYHAGSFTQADKSDIIFRRCAEVLVPHELGLEHLRAVLCRSQAEHETLIDLLSDQAKATYSPRIGISDKVHYKQWTFVESVDKTRELTTIRFSPWTNAPMPFRARAEFLTVGNELRRYWEDAAFCANSNLKLDIKPLDLDQYRVRLTLDNHLAFSGIYGGSESLL